MSTSGSRTSRSRPRVAGDRESEILAAAHQVLTDVGYDRFSFDAVAKEAAASKATLYRRWANKAELVLDALGHSFTHDPLDVPDTGSLRGDLIALHCSPGGLAAGKDISTFGALITALATDPEFAEVFRERFIKPKVARSRAVFEDARNRGEIGDDLDLDLIVPAMSGILLHRAFVLGIAPSPEAVVRVVDHVILPAVQAQSTISKSSKETHA